jgi:hypothetical protein
MAGRPGGPFATARSLGPMAYLCQDTAISTILWLAELRNGIVWPHRWLWALTGLDLNLYAHLRCSPLSLAFSCLFALQR